MAFSKRGLGWKKDLAKGLGETPDFEARPKLGVTIPPKTATNRSQIISMIDQGQASSCTANAVALIIRAAMIKEGIKNPELVSRLFLYYMARAYDHDTFNDSGAYLRNVFKALLKFGFPRESLWPYSDETNSVNAPFRTMPPTEAFHQAFDQIKGAAYHRITTTGQERVMDVKRAIAAGYCVVFGTLVSNDFVNNKLGNNPILPPVNRTIAGGHALCLAEYNDYESSFGSPNTWGTSWGAGGWCRFAYDYISWIESQDFWICDVVPKFSDVPVDLAHLATVA